MTLFFLICLFSTTVTAILFLIIEGRIGFLANWAFLFHFNPILSCIMYCRYDVKTLLRNYCSKLVLNSVKKNSASGTIIINKLDNN